MPDGRSDGLMSFHLMASNEVELSSSDTVFGQELAAVRSRRNANFPPDNTKAVTEASGPVPGSADDGSLPSTAHDLAGIALSGGGIRSSAFGMGALQALSRTPRAKSGKAGCLSQFDYISTVSGGGYTGAALAVAVSSEAYVSPGFPFGDTNNEEGETSELRHIRDNSRYLLHGGAIRAVISFIVIYLRGLVMSAVALALPMAIVAAVLALIGWWLGNYSGQAPLARAVQDFVAALLPAQTLEMFHAIALRWVAALAALQDLFLAAAGSSGRQFEIGTKPFLQLQPFFWGMLTVLLLLLAVIVSSVSGSPLLRRTKFTTAGAWIFSVCFLLPLAIHVNLWFMKIIALASDQQAVSQPSAALDLLTRLVGALTTASPYLAAALVAILPFIRKLIDKSFSALADGISARISRAGSRILLTAVALVLPLILWGMTLRLALFFQQRLQTGEPISADVGVLVAAAVVCFLLSLILNTNANSLHQLYRDRLSGTFIRLPFGVEGDRIPDDFKLSDFELNRAPYPIICAALNLPGSHYANRRARNADFFVMTPKHFGCEPLKYVSIKKAETIDGLNLGTAMAISGAAVAPNMGLGFSSKLAFTLAFLNVRLGRWMHRPDILAGWDTAPRLAIPNVGALWSEALGWSGKPVDAVVPRLKQGEKVEPTLPSRLMGRDFILLSDGGHIDNLGVFELLRRRCSLIVAIDGEADPAINCPSLAQLLRLARLDLGVTIDLDPRPIAAGHALACLHIDQNLPGPAPGTQFHAAAGVINYPKTNDGLAKEQGFILYIKASLTGDEYSPVRAYRQRNQTFPQETTGDQMFSEEQYEAYRSLGDHAVRRLIDGLDQPTLPYWLGAAEQRKIHDAVLQRL